MTTNSKEYMREYQRARRAKMQKSLQENVKKSVKIVKIFDLHPPKMVEKEGVEQGEERMIKFNLSPDSKTIDFSYLTNNSSFQRAIMEFIRRFVPGLENIKVRGNKEVMKQSFNANVNNYRNVMIELKEVLELRKK